jgi:uncharacterized membrane protein
MVGNVISMSNRPVTIIIGTVLFFVAFFVLLPVLVVKYKNNKRALWTFRVLAAVGALLVFLNSAMRVVGSWEP